MAWTGFQWPVLIGRSGVVKQYTVWHYTVLLVLTSRLGFAAAGFSNEPSDSVKGEKFLDRLNVCQYIYGSTFSDYVKLISSYLVLT